MKEIKAIHFTGIKGVGMTPLAIIAKQAGFNVSGSDVEDEFITDSALRKAGIMPYLGFSASHIQSQDIVITTGAHGGFNNPEVLEALDKKIKVWSQGEAVGEFMKGNVFKKKFKGISVAGSHGKTTTSAMIATVFSESGLDPSFAVGTSEIEPLGLPGHYGQGNYFIAEADEYSTDPVFDKTPKLFWQHPKIAVFTNIDFDHPDIYDSVESIRLVFLEFARRLEKDSVLIVFGDDPNIKTLVQEYKGLTVSYGYSETNDFVLKKEVLSLGHVSFRVESRGISLGNFSLKSKGIHNSLNALASIAVGMQAGIGVEKIRQSLAAFAGSKRRFEYVGHLETGEEIYDDYAHHPAEIKKTLLSFRKLFPKKKIICVFQPHTYSRTKTMFNEFTRSFDNADDVIILPIYASLRELYDPAISSQKLAREISNFHQNILFLNHFSDVVEYIEKKQYGKNGVIITMGAGDVYKINQKLKIKS